MLLEGNDVYVFADAAGGAESEVGEVGFVSTNGGGAFEALIHNEALSWTPSSASTIKSVVPLPGGNIGFWGVVAGKKNPTFQAVPLTDPEPVEDSEQTKGPFAELNFQSSEPFDIGDVGGQFASQLSGSEGVLGVFGLTHTGPCPTSEGIVYAFASLPVANEVPLNTSPGDGGSAWEPLKKLTCEASDPAVAGGPSGLGVLDEDEAEGTIVYWRFTAGPKSFEAPRTVAGGKEVSPSLSQDGAGNIYGTWIAGSNELMLNYSATAGEYWDTPVALVSGGSSDIDDARSSVNAAGQGWAVYDTEKTEYAVPFTATTVTNPPVKTPVTTPVVPIVPVVPPVVPPAKPQPEVIPTTLSQTVSFEGQNVTLSAPNQCVSKGLVKGSLEIVIPSHKRKGKVVVKIYKVTFTVGAVSESITHKKLSDKPFSVLLHVKNLTPGKKYVLSARAFIAVHHGKPRSRTLHVPLTVCS